MQATLLKSSYGLADKNPLDRKAILFMAPE